MFIPPFVWYANVIKKKRKGGRGRGRKNLTLNFTSFGRKRELVGINVSMLLAFREDNKILVL